MVLYDDATDRPERRSLDRIARGAAAALLDVPLVLISIVDRARRIIVGAHGLAAHDLQGKDSCALCRDVAFSGKPIVVQDVRSRLTPADARDWGPELVAYAGVPLSIMEGTRVGTLAAFAMARRTWQSRDLLVLRALAEAAGAVLDMQSRYASLESRVVDLAVETAERERATSCDHRRITLELETRSLHDELTGLLNRRGLFAIGNARLEASRRGARSGLLLYIDLDGLKATNDRFGHAAGDELLRVAAGVLRCAFRDSDTVARLGGDEFVVLATDTPRSEHPALVAHLTAELDRCNDRRDPEVPLAWSVGLVSIDPAAGGSLDALISEADRQMYSVKRALHRRELPNRCHVIRP
jgi:diguanylate cyclase (GGDEF)-like protein